MLVLSRKKDEQIVIRTPNEEIVLIVTEVRGEKVRLGVAAPDHVTIHRREVQELVDRGCKKVDETQNSDIV